MHAAMTLAAWSGVGAAAASAAPTGADVQRGLERLVEGPGGPPGAIATMYRSHTGNIPGYVQWVAATADGRRAVTTSLNIPAPSGKLLAQLGNVQATAVCALLAN